MKKLVYSIVAVLVSSLVYETDAQWTKLGGPGGGCIRALINISDKLFAGTDNGIFISTDTGANWKPASDGLIENKSITALAVSKGYLVAGTLKEGIYKSVIGTTCSWSRVAQIEAGDSLSVLVADDSIILAGTRKGKLLISKDGGTSWSVNDFCFDGKPVNAITLRESFAIASAGEDLFISRNYTGWNNLHMSNPTGFHSIHTTDNLIIAASKNGKVFISNDSGAGWKPVVNGLNNAKITCFASNRTEILAGSCSDDSGGTGGIFISKDHGESWTILDSTIINHNIISIVMFTGKIVAGTEYDGVFQKSIDEDFWNTESNGVNPPITKLYITNCEIFAGTEHGLYLSTDGAKTWKRNQAIDPEFKITALQKYDYRYIAGTNAGGIYCSSDDALAWKKMDAFDSILCIAVNDSFILAGNTKGIQFCRTYDSVWTWVNYSFPQNGILSVATHDSIVFAGGYHSGIFRSSDYGKTWQQIDTSMFPASITTSIVISGDTVIASSAISGLYRSTDNGIHWDKLTGITADRFDALVKVNNIIVVSTLSQVYYSKDFGISWNKAISGLENKRINSLFTSGNELYAGTELYGIWHRSVSDILTPVVNKRTSQLISDVDGFDLKQINTSKAQTVIKFTLQKPAFINIRMYNMHGQQICVPVNNSFTAGFHSIRMGDARIAPGFYYVKMWIGKRMKTYKFLKAD